MSIDDVLAALSNVQRRQLLESLIADSPPDNAAKSGVVVDDDIAMHHGHLPKLADYGLVTWDKDTNRVTKGPNFEDAKPALESLAEHGKETPVTEVNR
ncbi:transcriptional regulator [Halobacterium sp. R2-5]|nr:transcriptional regulator [Halobacterium sp. R2-5]